MSEDLGTEKLPKGDDMISIRFKLGAIVVAKLGRHPYWPAMVDTCVDTGETYWIENYNDPSQKHASHYNVVFFDGSGKVTRSWVPNSRIADYSVHFPIDVCPDELAEAKKLKPTSVQRNLVEARVIAESALTMSIEERIKNFAFLNTYKGKITIFDDDGGKTIIKATAGAKKRRSKSISKPSRTSIGDDGTPAKRKRGRKPKGKPAAPAPELSSFSPNDEVADRVTDKLHSPAKPQSAPRASSELDEQLSEFAKTYPPSPDSVSETMPKRRGRKRKGANQYTTKKKAKVEQVTSVETVPPVIETTTARLSASSEEVTKSTSATLTSQTVTETPTIQDRTNTKNTLSTKVPCVPVTPKSSQAEPEETLEMKMSSVLQRMQHEPQLPGRLQTKKTVSNAGLTALATDSVIDLTDEMDEVTGIPWERGEVVFAHLNNMPPWPAVIDVDPKAQHDTYFTPIEQPEYVHVVFLEMSYSAWVPLENVAVYDEGRLQVTEPVSYKFQNAVKNARLALALPRTLRTEKFGSSTVNAVTR